jgi:hypothetical protein
VKMDWITILPMRQRMVISESKIKRMRIPILLPSCVVKFSFVDLCVSQL